MSAPARPAASRPMRVFAAVWLGQLVSLTGSALSRFAIGLHIYQGSDSVTPFALISFFYFLPMVALSPVAGALVDRWDRRRAVLLGDLGAGFSTLLLWLLLVADRSGLAQLQPWHVYATIVIGSVFGALRLPAIHATTALLVPKQHLGRANGLLDLAVAIAQIGAPVASAALLARSGIEAVVLIDLATYLFAALTVLLVRFPAPPRTDEGRAAEGSLGKELAYGFSFIGARPGLRGLLLQAAITNLAMGLVTVLITPLVMSFADVPTLAFIQSVAGAGMLAGGVAMSAWGGPRRRMTGLLAFTFLSGLALLLAALPPTATTIALAAAAFLFCLPPITSAANSIWQLKVPPDVQGRVFAARRMVSLATPPLAGLVAGPLCDRLFEPWLAPGGALAGSVGRVLGTGPGRGVAFLLVAIGLLLMGSAVAVFLSPRVRRVEDDLPDALAEAAPAHAPQGST
ncbi:MFS transporter [Sorangium sp. So ce1024]|uniref:MFS transporter n=1 Tax=unclassified Sorangium TaxID=2621164 RepID=UPI003F026778